MPAAALAAAAVGIGGAIAANAGGVGKNDTRAKTFDETGKYDPNRYEYGGRAGLADRDVSRYNSMAQGAHNRDAPHAGLVGVDYGNANGWGQKSVQDRTNQSAAARLMMQRAQGLVPSIASQQAKLDMQRAAAAQASAGASARGAAGLALAQQNAANNTATMQSAISNQAQVNGAQERLAAEQGAFGAYSGIRQGDQQNQAMAAQQAQYAAQLGAQQRQFNAGMQNARNAQNDAYSLGLYNQGQNVRQMQMQGNLAQQGVLSNSTTNATNQNVAISQNNANREFDYLKMAMGALSGGASAAAGGGGGGGLGSDDRMKTGITPIGLIPLDAKNPNPNASSDFEMPSGGGGGSPWSVPEMGHGSMQSAAYPMPVSTYPGGSPHGAGLLSDDRAKRAYYLLGRQDGSAAVAGESPEYPRGMQPFNGQDEDFVVTSDGRPEVRRSLAGTSKDMDGLVKAAVAARNSGSMFDRDAQYAGRPAKAHDPFEDEAAYAAQFGGADSVRRYPGAPADPITSQLATGLAPIRFQYKPGMGPPGEQTGVRAQAAAQQPVTASMIEQRPDGLLSINQNMGLSTALAGVGHLAQKQEENEAKLNGLLSRAARREGY